MDLSAVYFAQPAGRLLEETQSQRDPAATKESQSAVLFHLRELFLVVCVVKLEVELEPVGILRNYLRAIIVLSQ